MIWQSARISGGILGNCGLFLQRHSTEPSFHFIQIMPRLQPKMRGNNNGACGKFNRWRSCVGDRRAKSPLKFLATRRRSRHHQITAHITSDFNAARGVIAPDFIINNNPIGITWILRRLHHGFPNLITRVPRKCTFLGSTRGKRGNAQNAKNKKVPKFHHMGHSFNRGTNLCALVAHRHDPLKLQPIFRLFELLLNQRTPYSVEHIRFPR